MRRPWMAGACCRRLRSTSHPSARFRSMDGSSVCSPAEPRRARVDPSLTLSLARGLASFTSTITLSCWARLARAHRLRRRGDAQALDGRGAVHRPGLQCRRGGGQESLRGHEGVCRGDAHPGVRQRGEHLHRAEGGGQARVNRHGKARLARQALWVGHASGCRRRVPSASAAATSARISGRG